MKPILLSIFLKIIILILLIPILYKIIILGSALPKTIIEKYGEYEENYKNIQYLILAATVAKNEADSEVISIETGKSSNITKAEKNLEIAHNAIKIAFNIFHNLYSIEKSSLFSPIPLSSLLSLPPPPPLPLDDPPSSALTCPITEDPISMLQALQHKMLKELK